MLLTNSDLETLKQLFLEYYLGYDKVVRTQSFLNRVCKLRKMGLIINHHRSQYKLSDDGVILGITKAQLDGINTGEYDTRWLGRLK